MKKNIVLFFICYLLSLNYVFSQVTVRGSVIDASTLEPLIGATIIYGKGMGTVTDFDGNFNLYLGLNELSRLFEDSLYLMIFWTHFIAINLFVGGWIVKDAQKFSINKILLAAPLIITYLIGPFGIFIYWIIRIFYAKRIDLYE